jgi:hypothetical protein
MRHQRWGKRNHARECKWKGLKRLKELIELIEEKRTENFIASFEPIALL